MLDIPELPDMKRFKFDREIVLRNNSEWLEFIQNNGAAIAEQYGSEFNPHSAAKYGGFTMGGGANPLTLIRLEY